MGSGFEHAALAVFTTLAPMGAASFIALAYAFVAGKPDAETAKRLDRWTAVPAIVMVAGFVGAFMHLANPLNAFGVFAGVGSSPLSNEIVAGLVFAVAALVYWVLALAGKLSGGARNGFLVVLSVLALVFAVFCGLAYMMGTIPTWNTPLSIVQMVGYALAGGTVLGFCVVGLAHAEMPKGAPAVALALALVGVLVGAVGFGAQIAGLDAIRNIWGSAAALVPAIWGLFGTFAVCGIVAAGLTYAAGKKAFSPAFMIVACVVVAIGIFVARIGFYGLYMGVAL
ncbi:dimethyl sulfoxide reductase anchor subunit family protein [Gordonibacter massiliensis (ex Traore et al. 2017)]|uniref:Dimethyl sulfoxide reductase anchor subunit n=1 Tax=Gordonibacter massiliensis (ex Traore et al. 2017) TaxID=1841863 RepID=A0A842JDU5_9ACTN|nr:DmsC/YnfH family molybdoenzyme membrane anchor subunit [Gordonibacter massiliensis (ex Traore et al. 2017)]MBC2888065.1 dimethyl sulfoxide reductase anchor subunit [Gordonibacter massiliensis (ex Traore et al. 2017)]